MLQTLSKAKLPIFNLAKRHVYRWKKLLQPTLGYYYTQEYLKEQIAASAERIAGLTQKDFKPWKVFIVFKYENEQ